MFMSFDSICMKEAEVFVSLETPNRLEALKTFLLVTKFLFFVRNCRVCCFNKK
jgi:hypothetical protein